MTARDDNTIGDTIGTTLSGGYYADTALYLNGPAGTTYTLTGLRILHAANGIVLNQGASHQFTHVQMYHCQNAITTPLPSFSLRNALLANVESCFVSTSTPGTFPVGQVQHLTVDSASWLDKNNALIMSYVNCLVSGIGNIPQNGVGASSKIVSSSPSIFQTAIGGSRYLADDTYRNIGNSGIDSDLKADLRRMTTYPPILVAGNYTQNSIIWPRGIADSDPLDYGYHYPLVDYVWSGTRIQNCSVTLMNGITIGLLGPVGVTLDSGAGLVSQGLPAQLNGLYRMQAIQEQVPASGTPVNFISDLGNVSVWPTVSLKFTEISGVGNTAMRCVAGSSTMSPSWSSLTLKDCQLKSVYLTYSPNTYVSGGPSSATATLLNNLISGGGIFFYKSYGSADSSFTLVARNNLFLNASLYLVYDNGAFNPPWTVYDNLFDHGVVTVAGGYTSPINILDNGFFSSGSAGSSPKVLSNLIYASGKLGNNYYSLTTGDASTLVHTGSTAAGSVGLYHYTVKASAVGAADSQEGSETPNTVSIGFHYVATDSAGNPADTDGDGVADYLEDANGNGLLTTGETDWQRRPLVLISPILR